MTALGGPSCSMRMAKPHAEQGQLTEAIMQAARLILVLEA